MTERRYDLLTGQWRTFLTRRQEGTPSTDRCPLCPTKPGAPPTDVPEAAYQIVVLDNRFAALRPDPPDPSLPSTYLYRVEPSYGAAELVLYTDQHDLTFADLPVARIVRLIDVWADRYAVLGGRDEVEYVFIFENKGVETGVTMRHPHAQIYGFPDIPPAALAELVRGQRHRERYGTCVMCDVVATERADGARVLAANDHFLAYVPFAARFPYEVHIASKRHATSLLDLTDPERWSLAEMMKRVTTGFDALFDVSLPYVMSMHQAPVRGERWLAVSHLHIEFTPPNRTAETVTYLAGSEIGAQAFINDTSPEVTAGDLRRAFARASADQAFLPPEAG